MIANNLVSHKLKYQSCQSKEKSIRRKLDSPYYNKYFRTQSKTEKLVSSPRMRTEQQKQQKLKSFKSEQKFSIENERNMNKHKQSKISWSNQKFNSGTKIQKSKKLQMGNLNNIQTDKMQICNIHTEQPHKINFFHASSPHKFLKTIQSQQIAKKLPIGKYSYTSIDLQRFKPEKQQLKVQKINKKKLNMDPFKNINLISRQKSEETDLQFLRNLKFNEVFFCTYCYRYIFAVQKHFHYPQCQQMHKIYKLNQEQLKKFGEERVIMVKELSKYANIMVDQVQNAINLAQENKCQIKIKLSKRYLSTNNILTALKLIYADLVYAHPEAPPEKILEPTKKQKISFNKQNSINSQFLA